MKVTCIFLGLLATTFCAAAPLSLQRLSSINEVNNKIHVELLVLSGSTLPSWTADLSMQKSVEVSACALDQYPAVGYQGIVAGGRLVKGSPALEKALIDSAPAGLISEEVMAYVKQTISKLDDAAKHCSEDPVNKLVNDFDAVPSTVSQSIKLPIIGPDTVPVYDPQHDDDGYFVSHCGENNCYNYATDYLTDSFAKPGRGSGQMFQYNTCDDVKAAAERDGLTYIGMKAPEKDPSTGHLVSLFIWPNVNFHWARRDTNGKWSHKPGQTPIKDVDNDNRPITDPSKADLSPWTKYCGVFHVVPSKITIQ